MTRTITTAAELDALPFPNAVTFPGYGDWYKLRDGRWLCDDGDVLTSGALALVANGELTVTGDPSAPAAQPEPNDAAMRLDRVTDLFETWATEEAEHRAAGAYGIAEGLKIASDGLREAVHGVPSTPAAQPVVPEAAVEAFKAAWHKADDEGREGERVRDGLTAALPHLTAQPAPEASREDVVSLLVGLGALSPDPAKLVADVLLARFVVTDPHEDGCPHTPEASREDLPGIINGAAFEDAARSEHHAEGLLARFVITERGDR